MATADAGSRLGCTLDALLARRAETHGARPFVRFDDGEHTYAEVHAASERLAAGLAAVGVQRGDVVPVLLSNSVECVHALFALCRLGAAACMVNPGLRGAGLGHALTTSASRVVIAEDAVVDQISAIHPSHDDSPTTVTPRIGGWTSIDPDAGPAPDATHRPTDPAMVLFTSGTTGPAKGCVLSHRYVVRQAELIVEHLRLQRDDVLYSPFPMFHIDATVLTLVPALVLGTTAAIGRRFSVSRFWEEVRQFGATVFDFMGATLTMLHKQPERPDDAVNPARLAWGVPVPDFAPEFESRFDLQLVELYGSTDVGVPIYQPLDEPRRQGSCGRVIPGYDVRLLDDEGFDVAEGEVGEIAVRPLEPSLIADGYLGDPVATLQARRDLWFHTNDLARRDADGFYYFVGRRTDSIRRRGENISAFEVEEVVATHPAVATAAAYGVPSELTEDEVMVAVVARPGATLDLPELVEFCRARMAAHMVPRYFDVLEELPRTPTEKVRKELLRARGVTADTWDRSTWERGT